MSQERLSMRKIGEVLCLKWVCGLSNYPPQVMRRELLQTLCFPSLFQQLIDAHIRHFVRTVGTIIWLS